MSELCRFHQKPFPKMWWCGVVNAVLVASAAPPNLPAPMTDYWVPAGWSYHNVATLGPSPRMVTTAVTQSLTDLEVKVLLFLF